MPLSYNHEAAARDADGKNGVQSLEIGVLILRAISSGHRAMMLKDIADAVDMPASKVHRYIISLVRSGLVEQDPMTSRYDLGPFALSLGLVAVDRLDRVKQGLSSIADLRDEINQTTALAIWSDKGPVIIRSVRPFRPITVSVVTGTALSLLSSASGRVFTAHLPRSVTKNRIAREQASQNLSDDLKTQAGVDAMLAQVMQDGVSTVADSYLIPGVAAAAAPVFNFKHEITLAILVLGVKDMMDLSMDGPVVSALKRSAQALSARLGHTSVT